MQRGGGGGSWRWGRRSQKCAERFRDRTRGASAMLPAEGAVSLADGFVCSVRKPAQRAAVCVSYSWIFLFGSFFAFAFAFAVKRLHLSQSLETSAVLVKWTTS